MSRPSSKNFLREEVTDDFDESINFSSYNHAAVDFIEIEEEAKELERKKSGPLFIRMISAKPFTNNKNFLSSHDNVYNFYDAAKPASSNQLTSYEGNQTTLKDSSPTSQRLTH